MAGFAFLGTQPHAELAVFQQSDKAAPEAEEIGSAHDESFQKFFQIAYRAQLGRNLQKLVEFVGLIAGSCVELGVRYGHCAKAGHCGNQRSLIVGEDAVRARVDKNGALRTRGAKGRGQKHAGGHQVSESMRGRIDGDGDRFPSGNSAGGDVGRKA